MPLYITFSEFTPTVNLLYLPNVGPISPDTFMQFSLSFPSYAGLSVVWRKLIFAL